MVRPLISFCGPVYNKVAYIGDTIKNLQKQTLKNVEFVFVDDGSTDGTPDLIKFFARKDKRIRLYRLKKNLGLGKAWNIAHKLARADIIAVISGDDIWVERRGQIIYDFFRKHKDKDVFYGAFCFCDYNMRPIEYKKTIPFSKKKLLAPREDGFCSQFIGHFVVAYRKKIALKVPMRENLRVGIDYPFLVDLSNAGARFGWTKKLLGYARLLNTGVSIARRREVVESSKI